MFIERAVILAAGVGSRLKWLTKGRPKALMPVAGVAAIVHVIRALSAQGVRDIAINVHHYADQLIDHLGDGSRFGVRLYFSREQHLLDSGGGVKKALMLLPGEGWFVVHNADVLSHTNVQELASFADAHKVHACLGLTNNPSHHPEGDYSLQSGLVRARKPAGATYTYSGVAIFHEDVFNAYAADHPFPLNRLFSDLIAQESLCGIIQGGMWLDIGRPRDLLNASKLLR